MAMVHGKGAAIAWAGTGTEETTLLSWSVEASADVADATNISSTNDWKEYLAGFKGWTATVEVNYNGTVPTGFLATDLGGTAAALTLYFVAAGAGITGSAICTGWSASADKDDIIKVTYSFQGTGALAAA
jgi:predicted secreted protein